jgi:hypothetical protein
VAAGCAGGRRRSGDATRHDRTPDAALKHGARSGTTPPCRGADGTPRHVPGTTSPTPDAGHRAGHELPARSRRDFDAATRKAEVRGPGDGFGRSALAAAVSLRAAAAGDGGGFWRTVHGTAADLRAAAAREGGLGRTACGAAADAATRKAEGVRRTTPRATRLCVALPDRVWGPHES